MLDEFGIELRAKPIRGEIEGRLKDIFWENRGKWRENAGWLFGRVLDVADVTVLHCILLNSTGDLINDRILCVDAMFIADFE